MALSMKPRSPLAWLLAGIFAPMAAAQGPELVTDINRIAAQPNPSSDPTEFAQAGSHEMFSAYEPTIGREPFSATAHWDIRPGAASSNPREFTRFGQMWIFSAHTADKGRELILLPPSGVPEIVDIHRGVGSSNPVGLTVFNGRVFFSAKNSPTNRELWATDGTAQGTARVLDINPGQAPSNPGELTVVEDFSGRHVMAFVADNGVNGVELWKTDGTPSGTMLAYDLQPGSASSSPAELIASRGLLYFAASSPATGRELWFVTAEALRLGGSARVHELQAGATDGNPRELVEDGSYLYFLANRQTGSTSRSEELWSFTITASFPTARLLTTFTWQTGQMPPADLTAGMRSPSGTPMVFLTADSSVGREVVGAAARPATGQTGVATWNFDVRPGTAGSDPRELTVVGPGLFFTADDGTGGREPHRIRVMTIIGFSVLRNSAEEIVAGPQGSDPSDLRAGDNGRLYLAADDGIHGKEAWQLVQHGPPAVFDLLRDVNRPTLDADPGHLTDAYGITYFAADDGVTGTELWRTDGTAQGTSQVMDIQPGPGSSSPENLTLLGNRLFFVADDGANGAELWAMDVPLGTPQLLADIWPGTGSSNPEWLTVVDDGLLFCASDGVHGRELWRSNGTNAGTAMVLDIRPGPASSGPRHLEALGRVALFSADDGVNGRELWRSNGTVPGTILLLDIQPGSGSGTPHSMEQVGQAVWFAADDGSTGHEPWRSNGHAAGTRLWADIRSGALGSDPVGFTRVGADKLFFFANDGSNGRELWSVGPAGAYMVRDVNIGTFGSNPSSPTAAGDRLFFAADDGIHGDELWVSDGTTAGTHLTRDILPSRFPAFPGNLFASGSRKVYFTAQDGATGYELWESDGTQAGTVQVADLRPGQDSSTPGGFVLSRGVLLFAAERDQEGRELWRLDPGASVQELGVGCARSTLAPTLVATDPVLGQTMTVTGFTPSAGVLAWLLLSDPLPAAVPLPIPGGTCFVHVNLTNALMVGAAVPSPTTIQTGITIPNHPSFQGMILALQAARGPTASPLGVDVTSALVVRMSSR